MGPGGFGLPGWAPAPGLAGLSSRFGAPAPAGLVLSALEAVSYTHLIALCRYCSARWKGIQMPEGLTCPNCDSPSVVYPEATKDHAAVACGGCGTFLATRGQFRQLLERQAVQSRMVTTGC